MSGNIASAFTGFAFTDGVYPWGCAIVPITPSSVTPGTTLSATSAIVVGTKGQLFLYVCIS